MKYLFLLFGLFLPLSLEGATASCSNIVDQTEPFSPFINPGSLQFYLPHGTGSGNAIIVGVTGSPGDTISVSDNGSNTYNTGASELDTTNSQDIYLFYALNVASGTTKITVAHSATDYWFTAWAMECTNVAPSNALDGYSGNFANSQTVTAGPVTPTASGDLVVQFFWNDYTVSLASCSAGSQSNITWTLAQADRSTAMCAQWGVYSSTSPLNPTMSAGTSGFISAAMFLKSAAAGTAFPSSGMGITAMKTFWIGNGTNEDNLPRTEQFACASSNNAMIVEWLGGGSGALSGVTDSNSNAWKSTGPGVCNSIGGCTSTYYAQNATVSPNQSLTFSGTVAQDSAKGYCVSGASTTNFFDKTVTATASQGSPGNLNALSIAPSTSNGLVIGAISVASNTMIGVTGAGQMFTGCLWNLEDVTFGGCDENNGWAYYLNPNPSSVNFTFTEWNGSTAAGDWSARADAFEGAGTVVPAAPTGLTATPH